MMTERKARAARRSAALIADHYIAPDGSPPLGVKAPKLDKAAKKVERIECAIRVVRAALSRNPNKAMFEFLVAILTTDYGVDP
jgi:hypothetical protein